MKRNFVLKITNKKREYTDYICYAFIAQSNDFICYDKGWCYNEGCHPAETDEYWIELAELKDELQYS